MAGANVGSTGTMGSGTKLKRSDGKWMHCIQACYLSALKREILPPQLLMVDQLGAPGTLDSKYQQPYYMPSLQDLVPGKWTASLDQQHQYHDIAKALVEKLCAYQSARLRRANRFKRGSLCDPINLFCEEFKHWLLAFASSHAPWTARKRLDHVSNRVSYLKLLHASGVVGSKNFLALLNEIMAILQQHCEVVKVQLTTVGSGESQIQLQVQTDSNDETQTGNARVAQKVKAGAKRVPIESNSGSPADRDRGKVSSQHNSASGARSNLVNSNNNSHSSGHAGGSMPGNSLSSDLEWEQEQALLFAQLQQQAVAPAQGREEHSHSEDLRSDSIRHENIFLNPSLPTFSSLAADRSRMATALQYKGTIRGTPFPPTNNNNNNTNSNQHPPSSSTRVSAMTTSSTGRPVRPTVSSDIFAPPSHGHSSLSTRSADSQLRGYGVDTHSLHKGAVAGSVGLGGGGGGGPGPSAFSLHTPPTHHTLDDIVANTESFRRKSSGSHRRESQGSEGRVHKLSVEGEGAEAEGSVGSKSRSESENESSAGNIAQASVYGQQAKFQMSHGSVQAAFRLFSRAGELDPSNDEYRRGMAEAAKLMDPQTHINKHNSDLNDNDMHLTAQEVMHHHIHSIELGNNNIGNPSHLVRMNTA